MANGFGSLYVGASGLRGAQNSLNTTANNMSNVDTKGYVRQQVRYADMSYNKLKTASANVNLQQCGLGVSIGDVVHARDIFLDKTFRLESGRKEFYGVRDETVDYVTDLMQELNGEQFKQSVEDLWQAFQELSTKVAVPVYQNLVLEKAELLVSRSQALYKDLQNYQENINIQIKEDVERVNEIGNQIYDLNLQIQKVEAAGVETAMTLRDVRDNLLDELATYGRIEVTEDATGFAYVDFEAVRFVDDNCCYNMGLKTEDGTGFYTPYWPHLSNLSKEQYYNVYNMDVEISSEMNTDVGGIKSKLFVRGDGYGKSENFGKVDKDGNFVYDPSAYDEIALCTVMKTEAQIDMLFTTIVKKMNDIFAPNTTLDELDPAAAAELNKGTNQLVLADGNPLVPPLDTKTTKILDAKHCPRGVDGELPPRELFVRAGCDRYTEVYLQDDKGKQILDEHGNPKVFYLYNEEKPSVQDTQYGIGSIGINRDLVKQITLMPAYTENGAVDYAFGEKLAAAWETADMRMNPYDQKPCKLAEFYDRVVIELGTEGNTYKSIQATLDGSVKYYDNERQKVSGVSSDEELTNMIKYQSAYNAASRFMTVISQMTELIVTGLI